MKKLAVSVMAVGAIILFSVLSSTRAQERSEKGMAMMDHNHPTAWEYAMIKWDGPDEVQYILPDKFEFVRMTRDLGIKLPKNAQEEQFYLTIAANKLAKDGWEAINLDSRRILFRRPAH